MNNPQQKPGSSEIVRAHLRNHHRKVYSICRLFANNYKEHQNLFTDIIAAASRSIQFHKSGDEKHVLLFRACLNMTALHSISRRVAGDSERVIEFKSPDYQRSMVKFRESLGEMTDYEKIMLFLQFEKVAPADIAELTGLLPVPAKAPVKEQPKKSFLPYLKAKLIWS